MSRSLKVGGDGILITWAFASSTFDVSASPDQLELGIVALPLDVKFPVDANLQFDGRGVWRYEFAQRTTDVMIISPARAQAGAKPFFQPGVEIDIRSGRLPSLLGIRHADLLVTSSDHKVRIDRRRAFPDWAIIQAAAAEVAAELEADRLEGKCRLPPPPVV